MVAKKKKRKSSEPQNRKKRSLAGDKNPNSKEGAEKGDDYIPTRRPLTSIGMRNDLNIWAHYIKAWGHRIDVAFHKLEELCKKPDQGGGKPIPSPGGPLEHLEPPPPPWSDDE